MISAIVLTKNEELNIEKCLNSLKWCDEIIVVDDNSKDRTVEIAKNLGAVVYSHPLKDDFSESRNFGLKLAKGEWVIFIDADEEVTKDLQTEIEETINNNNLDGIIIKRKDFIFGKWLEHGETSDIKLLRIAKRNAGSWKRKIHETWEIKGKRIILNNYLLHYPHRGVTEFLNELNRYSTLNAEVFFSEGIKTNCWQIVLYPTGKFIKNYFIKLGLFDGTPGFIHAMLMSFHSFLTRAKLWQLQHGK